jgi:hypothetical protein
LLTKSIGFILWYMVRPAPAPPEQGQSHPAPIDPRGPRFNQAVLATGLVLAFLFDVRLAVPILGLILFLGAALGPRWGLFLRIYSQVIRPRLSPPRELEDPRPPRFAAAVGALFLAAGTASFALGAAELGWALALLVAALAALAAVTGVCVGCEIYLLAARQRGRQLRGRQLLD